MTERQKYQLIRDIDGVEIRKYEPCVLADVFVNTNYENAGNLGFRSLVTYISQNNIAMTAPVIQVQEPDNSWRVSFVMPAGMNISKMPLPKNSSVSLREIKEHFAAALSFKGYTSLERVREMENRLLAILNRNKIDVVGDLQIARFDPPWKPGFMRHNEVIVEINYQ